MVAKSDRIYRVTFVNQNKVYEVYARSVAPSDLWGFIEIGDFVFGARSELVVDPVEEKLRQEFEDVEHSYIPMQSVIRIDEVHKGGVAKMSDVQGGTVMPFPMAPPKRSE